MFYVTIYSACNILQHNILNNYYSRRKNNCQKIQPAHSMITKRDFILHGICFCEQYISLSFGYKQCTLVGSNSVYVINRALTLHMVLRTAVLVFGQIVHIYGRTQNSKTAKTFLPNYVGNMFNQYLIGQFVKTLYLGSGRS